MMMKNKYKRLFAFFAVLIISAISLFSIPCFAYRLEYEGFEGYGTMSAPPCDLLWVSTDSGYTKMSEKQYSELLTSSLCINNINNRYDGGGYGDSGSVDIAWTYLNGSSYGFSLWIIDNPIKTYNNGFVIRKLTNVSRLDFCVDECTYRIYYADDLEHEADWAPIDATIYVFEEEATADWLVLSNWDTLDVSLKDACYDAWGYSVGYIEYATYSTGVYRGYLDEQSESYSEGYADGKNEGDKIGYSRGYDAGKKAGFAAADTSTAWMNFRNMIFSIFDAPLYALQNAFDFEIFGINFGGFFLSLIGLGLLVFFATWLLKRGG